MDKHRDATCPRCGAEPGEMCVTISGNAASASHLARYLPDGSYRTRTLLEPYRKAPGKPNPPGDLSRGDGRA